MKNVTAIWGFLQGRNIRGAALNTSRRAPVKALHALQAARGPPQHHSLPPHLGQHTQGRTPTASRSVPPTSVPPEERMAAVEQMILAPQLTGKALKPNLLYVK